MDFVLMVWLAMGSLNFGMKYSEYKDEWAKLEKKWIIFALLLAALVCGPIGLILSIYNKRKKTPGGNAGGKKSAGKKSVAKKAAGKK